MPQTEELKQQKFVSSQFWSLAVQGQGASKVSGEAALLGVWTATACCPHVAFLLSTLGERTWVSFPLLIRTPVL